MNLTCANPSSRILVPAKEPARWFGIAYDADPYRGCSLGCIYCDSRNAIPVGEAFDSIAYRDDAADLLAAELAAKPTGTIIGIGSLYESYNPLEPSVKLTRRILETIAAAAMGVVVVTKSDLVLADIDLLKRIREKAAVAVVFSVTATNEDVVKKLEPGAASTTDRFKAIAKLSSEGILTGVLMQPIVPFITDTEANVTAIVRRAKDAGAAFVYPSFGMNLSGRQRDHFFEMIDREFPRLKNVYMDYFGSRFSCQSKFAPALKKAFVFECKKLKIKYGMNDIVKAIKPTSVVQLKLF
ncbi:MAG: radical SAM protein [bacterium]